MGWLSRMFGKDDDTPQEVPAEYQGGDIPAERVGLDGEYDQSGLAKRVAQAFDEAADLDDIDTIWVAQTSGTVVLKGKAPADKLPLMSRIARGVDGTTDVDYSQVEQL